MPRVIYFVLCRHFIISQEGVVSLIDVAERIVTSGDVHPDGVTGQPIYGMAYFWRDESDAGKQWDMKLQIVQPDGTAAGDKELMPLTMKEIGHRHLITITEFPVGQVGTYHVQLALKESDTGDPWQQVADYPVEVRNTPSTEA